MGVSGVGGKSGGGGERKGEREGVREVGGKGVH